MTTDVAVAVHRVTKRYARAVGVNDVSFEIRAGEIFGVLGTNGAGKTTLVECMEGLRSHDDGTIRVLGLDPQRDAAELRQRMGVQLQSSGLQERVKVWEALSLFAAFYRRPVNWRELLIDVGLAESKDVAVARLSAGQKQRVFIALALVNRPEVVFLDELTSSLDPQARRGMWDLVRRVRDCGTTVVLTTHFMDEAERLCDRVAILHRGRVVALDSPARLVRQFAEGRRKIVAAGGGVTRSDQTRADEPALEDVFLELVGGWEHACVGG